MNYKFHEIQASKVVDIPVELMFTKTRKKEVVFARMLCMYFVEKNKIETQEVNAARFNMGHCSVIHSRDTLDRDMKYDKKLGRIINKYFTICEEHLGYVKIKESGVDVIRDKGIVGFIQDQSSVFINLINVCNQFIDDKVDDDKVLVAAELAKDAVNKIIFNFTA